MAKINFMLSKAMNELLSKHWRLWRLFDFVEKAEIFRMDFVLDVSSIKIHNYYLHAQITEITVLFSLTFENQ